MKRSTGHAAGKMARIDDNQMTDWYLIDDTGT